jgi:hypothetical protein
MMGPLVGDAGDSGALTTQCKNVDGGAPCEAMSEIQEPPPLNTKMSMTPPLGGDARDPGCPPLNAKTSMMAPWEVMPEIRELPPLNVKTSTTAPLGGDVRDPGA